MSSGYILFKEENAVATITLNRPDRLNALGGEMREELLAFIEEAGTNDAIRALVITGAGRAFCAGGDVKAMAEGLSRSGNRPLTGGPQNVGNQVVLSLRRLPKPVIASVNGVAVGAGCNLALACDIRIASELARFGEVFVRRGLHPDWGGTYLLPRLVGPARACELIFLGDIIDATEAERIGLVNRVVPADSLEAETKALAERLAKGPPLAIGLAKRAIYKGMSADLESALDYELYAQSICTRSKDAAEGIKSFVEKREPLFTGE